MKKQATDLQPGDILAMDDADTDFVIVRIEQDSIDGSPILHGTKVARNKTWAVGFGRLEVR